MDKTNRKRIGFYVRVSCEEQAQNPEGSIKNQQERLHQAVKLKNLSENFGEVVDIYIDRAKSGKDTNRSELQRMLKDIRQGKIDMVMASELSRISRSIKDFSDIWELMKSHNCEFQSLRENFDSSTAAGEMVLFTLANLSQFERRQVSERVALNMNARAKRGLYNGGTVPVGYKSNPEKPGYLEIEKDQAEIVKEAFSAFLREESLSKAAKWLNDNGYKLKRFIQGGGNKSRTTHFTVDNLHRILKNKAYVGKREYKENGEVKDAEAVWERIIDDVTFDRVGKILKTNRSKKKPHTKKRYPYILSGITYCKTCGDVMCGKSAHGKAGKIGYYEHSWATKRESCLSKKTFSCKPHRVLAKKLEPLVVSKVRELITQDTFAQTLLSEVKKKHEASGGKKEAQKLKAKIYGLNGQLEALAERLSQLPKTVSAAPIFNQMERLEERKKEVELQLIEIKVRELPEPVALSDYRVFLNSLAGVFSEDADPVVKSKVIGKLVHKVEIGTDSVKVHFLVGKDQFGGPATAGPLSKKFITGCSNSLTFGAPIIISAQRPSPP